jgi:tetratricopeptide (TPR) repeat protein
VSQACAASIAILFAAAHTLFAQNPADIGHLVASDLATGKYTEARELLDSALKKSPRDARLWTLNGLALVRLGNQRDALASYKTALQISPDYLPALESAAEIEYETGDAGAAELLRQILKVRPADKTSHAMLAAIAFKRGECETAAHEFAQSEESASTASELGELGACLVKRKRPAEAVSVFQRVSQLEPQDQRALYNLAVVQFLAGRYNEVITTLRPILTKPSPDADALELAGEAYEAISDTQHAMNALLQAVNSNPDISRYYVEFANLCLAHGASQSGIAVLNAGLRRLPDSASLYLARGLLFSELAQYEKGEVDFNTAEVLDPNVEFGSAIRGLAELQQNNLADAERMVRERLRVHENDALLYYLLAEILIKKGAALGSPEFSEALNSAKKAVDLQPNLAVANDVLARLYLEQGKTNEAIEQSRQALRSNPKDTTALYRLILALRKTNKTEQVPALVKQLLALRGQAQREEGTERKYTAVEQAVGQASLSSK